MLEDGNNHSQDSDTFSDGNESDTPLIHETLLQKSEGDIQSKPKAKKHDKIKTNESLEEKNCRTVFIGNVPIDCVIKKSTRQSLLDHILNPSKEKKQISDKTRIESVRFRGIPLAAPVAEDQRVNEKAVKRSKAWQESQAQLHMGFDNETGGRAGRRGAKSLQSSESTAAPPTQFLTSGQKRKIGFVTGNFHPEAKSCLAYVVIAHVPEGSQEGTNNVSARDLAKMIALKADGTTFLDHILRCDVAWCASSKANTKLSSSISLDEQRRTLYIGGLDFLEEEDSIRRAIESKLLEEKEGLPDGAPSWVERVRVIRDKATSLNKGFAYVLLRTQDAVEEMLALPKESFKIGKRKVRLQKYLSTGQASALKKIKDPKSEKNKKLDQNKNTKGNRQKTKQNETPRKRVRLDLTKEIETNYKGPDQSKELANLSKAERKTIKSNNQLRVERRMLKKQNKLKLKILSNNNSKSIDDTQTLKPIKNKLKHKKSVKFDSKTKTKKAKSKSTTKSLT